MKPPSKEAIAKAIQIILESFVTENGMHVSQEALTDNTNKESIRNISCSLIESRKAFLDDLDHLIAATHKLLNAHHPLLSLPAELALEIVQQALDRGETEEKSLVPQLQAFAGVSVSWWRMIVSAPELWCKVDLGDGCATAAMVLRKSGGQMLDVRCTGSASPALIQAIGKEAHRWRSAALDGSCAISEFRPFFQHELSTIQTLEDSNAGPHIDYINPTAMTRLRSLTLSDLDLAGPRVRRCHVQLPSPTELIGMLLLCPGLEALTLQTILSHDDVPLSPPSISEVPLLELRTLRIKGVSCRWTALLLHCIRAPSIIVLEIICSAMLAEQAIKVLREVMEPKENCEPLATMVFRNTSTLGLALELRRRGPDATGNELQLRSLNAADTFKVTLPCPGLFSRISAEQWKSTLTAVTVPVTLIMNYYRGPLHFFPYITTLESVEVDDYDDSRFELVLHSIFDPTAQLKSTHPLLSKLTYNLSRSLNAERIDRIKSTLLRATRPGCAHPNVLLRDSAKRIVTVD